MMMFNRSQKTPIQEILNSAQAHRHYHANEALERFEHPWADFVLHLEEHLVFAKRLERVHQKGRIERNLKVRTAIPDGHRLVRLTEIGTLGRQFEEIAR